MSYAYAAAGPAKSPDAFRTISEVAIELNVPQHVLRFWESRFGQVKPVKRAGGRRYYRPEDVDLLRGIRTLLYSDGVTIKGVQKLLREQGIRYVAEIGRGEARLYGTITDDEDGIDGPAESAFEALRPSEEILDAGARARLEALLEELLQLKSRLSGARAAPR